MWLKVLMPKRTVYTLSQALLTETLNLMSWTPSLYILGCGDINKDTVISIKRLVIFNYIEKLLKYSLLRQININAM